MGSTYNGLAYAITQEENNNPALNNPGALEDANGNMLSFSDIQDGMSALLDKLSNDIGGNSQIYSPTMTLSDFEKAYTGGDTNAGNNIASMLGVSPSIPVSQLSDQALAQQTQVSNPYAVDNGDLTTQLGPGTSITLNPSNNTITTTGPYGNASGGSAAGAKSQTGSASAPGVVASVESWLASSSANVVTVIIGLVLIAGAIFSFSAVKDATVKTVKTGIDLAKTAAVAA